MASVETETGSPSAEPRSRRAVGAFEQLAQLLATDAAVATQRTTLASSAASTSDRSFSNKPPSAAVLPPSASRKRARGYEGEKPPPLPKLSGDTALEVYTHRSLNRPGAAIDSSRLAVLGLSVLDATMTSLLFRRRPLLSEEDMVARREEALALSKVEAWAIVYGLMNKLRCDPALYPALQTTPERCRLFLAVVGGVYDNNGMKATEDWLGKLIFSVDKPEPASAPPAKKMKTTYNAGAHPPRHAAPGPSTSVSSSYIASPAAAFGAPVLQPTAVIGASAGLALPQRSFLLTFHEHAAKRGVRVDYETEGKTGPSTGQTQHWVMVCKVNSIPKGKGHGLSKQRAREFAARQAFEALGWV
ncbi:hypothetical protein BD626DRAFT_486319 [Schizophyllum amplum]|uniref:Uncharacterized protein n=1 Tax=Schizophyllum amplum TaxID=97359 RepID=A0A550CMC1_9AGAR|nr:hypothetical protein BD626DRAFT_486319 [Auriculariopsis ampla]